MLVFLLGALSAGQLAATPAAEDDPPPSEDGAEQFEIVRTTEGPSSFRFVARFFPSESSDLDAFMGSVALRTDRHGRVEQVEPLSATTIGHSNSPAIHVGGSSTGTCDLGQCELYATFGATSLIGLQDGGGPEALNRVLVAVEFDRIEIEFEGDGWELAETDVGYRYVGYRSSSGAGAGATPSQGADVFLRAEAEGGELGSIATAIPPCSSNLTPGVAFGVGTLTLTGGVSPPTTECPQVGNAAVADHASEGTAWAVTGAAAGSNTLTETRLFVVDLPSCEHLIAGVVGSTDDDCA